MILGRMKKKGIARISRLKSILVEEPANDEVDVAGSTEVENDTRTPENRERTESGKS